MNSGVTSAHQSPIVVALGGNAISPSGASDSISSQFEQTRKTAVVLAELIDQDLPVLITHGNGPQIGSAMKRGELASDEVYQVPLGVLVADLAGGMGYMIAQCVGNELIRRKSPRRVRTLITNVIVDRDDPAFTNPTKPIGQFYDADRAKVLQARGWIMTHVPNRGFRRVTYSPAPREIVEVDVIRRLIAHGETLVVAGGGGVPVYRDPSDQTIHGCEAVIDKDLTAGLLADAIGAGVLFIVTDVEAVALDFGQPTERRIERMTAAEAAAHLEQGQFPAGSMGPKISAAVQLLNGGTVPDRRVVISDIDHMHEALAGETGTTIVA